jgi:hypothetical protein
MTHVEAALREIDERLDALDTERGHLESARESLRGLLSGALPLKPSPVVRMPKAAPKLPRGASDGALEGRILTALERGPLAPGALAERVKVDRPVVAATVKALESRGVVRCEGATVNRRVMLAKAPKPKEAVS